MSRVPCAIAWCNEDTTNTICGHCRRRILEIREELGSASLKPSIELLELLWDSEKSELRFDELAPILNWTEDWIATLARRAGWPRTGVRSAAIGRADGVELLRQAWQKRQVISPKMLAHELGYRPETISKLCRSGAIPSIRKGRSWQIAPGFVQDRREEVTIEEAAAAVGQTVSHLRKGCREGKIKSFRLARRYRIPQTEAERLAGLRRREDELTPAQAAAILGQPAAVFRRRGLLSSRQNPAGRHFYPMSEVERLAAEITPPERTVSVREFGRAVGLSKPRVLEYCKERAIESFLWRDQRRIPQTEIKRFKASRPPRSWRTTSQIEKRAGIPRENLAKALTREEVPPSQVRRLGRTYYLAPVLVARIREEQNYLSAGEVAREVGLGVSRCQILRLAQQGVLQTEKPLVGKKTFPPEVVDVTRRLVKTGRLRPAQAAMSTAA